MSPEPSSQPALERLARLLDPLIANESRATAFRLLAAFGSIEGAVGASFEDLCRRVGTSRAKTIIAARDLVDASLQEIVERRPVDPEDPQLHRFLRRRLAHVPFEQLHAIFVDGASRYLHDETLAHGNADAVNAPLEKLARRATELQSSGVILAHNHPSGNPDASPEDIAATAYIERFCKTKRFRLLAHLIVAGNRVGYVRIASDAA